MRHRLAVVGLFATTALALTACDSLPGLSAATGTSGGASSSAASQDAEVVAWVDKVCGASLDVVKVLSVEPELDTTSAAKMQQQFAAWLGSGSTAIEQTVKNLDGLKSGPHRDSEKLVTGTTKLFTELKTRLDKIKTNVESVDANNPESVAATFPQVAVDMQAIGKFGADLNDVLVNSNLAAAKRKASNCQAIASVDTGGTTSTPPTS
jgi:hypothetical protein